MRIGQDCMVQEDLWLAFLFVWEICSLEVQWVHVEKISQWHLSADTSDLLQCKFYKYGDEMQ